MANSGHSKGAVVAASGRYGNRVFGRRHLFPKCVRSRRMWLPLKRDVPKSPSGANEQHWCSRQARPLRRPILFSVSHHHSARMLRAAFAAARCVTSGEKR